MLTDHVSTLSNAHLTIISDANCRQKALLASRVNCSFYILIIHFHVNSGAYNPRKTFYFPPFSRNVLSLRMRSIPISLHLLIIILVYRTTCTQNVGLTSACYIFNNICRNQRRNVACPRTSPNCRNSPKKKSKLFGNPELSNTQQFRVILGGITSQEMIANRNWL